MNSWMRWMGTLAALWITAAATVGGAGTLDPQREATAAITAAQIRQPLAFEPNRGQSAAAVEFLARGVGYGLYITADEAVFSLLPEREPAAARTHSRGAHGNRASANATLPEVLRLRWLGGQRPRAIEGLRSAAGSSRYLSFEEGASALTDVPRYQAVALRQVYPGVDLIFYGNQGQLEYDFELAPGADPSQIQLAITGASSLDVDTNGALVVGLQRGSTRFDAPIVYQMRAGERIAVPSRYVIGGNGEVHFELAPHDADLALVIDPVFVYSTYLGGAGVDYATGMALDSAGNVYVAGDTASSNFPTVPGGYDTSWNGGRDVFISKFNASGNGLIYSTYFGAAGDQGANDIAIDSAGNAWVTGYYMSGMFVLKLNASGSSVLFLETFTALNAGIYPSGIAVDASNSAFVVGTTFATDLPTVNPYQLFSGGGGDGFVRKYSSAGVVLASTYVGGLEDQWAEDVAIGPAGEVVVTGSNRRFDTLGNVWVFKLNNACTTLSYGVQFGGSAYDAGQGVTVDAAGNAYVVGFTESSDFPTGSALQLAFGGGWRDGFLYKLNSAGARIYSTYIGGSADEMALDVALNASGDVLVVGETTRDDPMYDAFLLSLNSAATSVNYSAVFGGSQTDGAGAVVADASGNVYVMGVTLSTNFPVTPGAYLTNYGGGFRDGWVAKIAPSNPVVSSGNASVVEGDAGTRNLSFPLTISARSAAQISVNWSTADGSATTADNDYVAASGTLVIPAGQLSATLNVVVNGDSNHETDETLSLTLTAPNNANATLGTATATGTISNDDAAPTIAIDDQSVAEGGTALFTVSLSRRSYQPVSMHWAAADGTATAPADYGAGAGTLTIPAGLLSLPITRPTIDDALDEDDETFVINLSAAVNATVADSQGAATIQDNDLPPSIAVDNGGCAVNEGDSGATPCPFIVRLSALSGKTVSFSSATANGSASAGSDFSGHAATARSIAPGQTSTTIAVPVLGDVLVEGPENFTLNLSAIQNASPGALSAIGSIIDDDINNAVFVSQNVPSSMLAGQSYPVSVRMRNTGTTTWTSAGQYRLGSANPRDNSNWSFNRVQLPANVAPSTEVDFNFTVVAPANQGNHDFQWQMVQDAVQWFGPTSANVVVNVSAPTLSIADVAVSEGDSGAPGVGLQVSLSPASTQTVTVNWTTNNANSVNVNPGFETPAVVDGGVATYSSGQSFDGWTVASGSVDLVGAALWYAAFGNQSLDLNGSAPGAIYQDVSVVAGQSYTISFQLAGNPGCAGPAVKTLELSWAGGVVGLYDFDVSGHSVPNIGYGVHQITVTAAAATQRLGLRSLSAGACGPVIDAIHVKPAGSAGASGDYVATSGTLTFAPGETVKGIAVGVIGDYAIEPNEDLWIDLSNPVNAALPDARAVLTINNNDQAGSLTIPATASAAEQSGTLGITLTRSAGFAQDVGAALNLAAGTAAAGIDFDASAQRIVFAGGQTSRASAVPLIDDVLDEADETFSASLSGAFGGALIGAANSTTATILDNDATPSLAVDNGGCSVAEGNSGSVNCAFVLRLSAISGRAVSFTTATANGTATAGSDYTAHSNIARSLAAGLPTLTVLVPVLGDTLAEANETFALNVTAISNATPVSLSATGTIVDDDTPAATGTLRLQQAQWQVSEAAGSLQIVVERVGGSVGAASVNYASSNGSAQAGLDYSSASGTLSWAAGDASSRTITLTIINDPTIEPAENFYMTLSQASGAGMGTPAVSEIVIQDGTNLLYASGFE